MYDPHKQQKSDSLYSLAAGAVRRPPPGRDGLPGIVAATGLALLLSACGGGGGAGAPNAGATLGGSAPSIRVDAAVAPVPVAEKAAPVAPKTPPPNPQARTPQTPKTPPPVDLPPVDLPPVDLPPVVENIPPQRQESPAPPTDMSIVTDPSTIPFPSTGRRTDETVDINTLGHWGHPNYQQGGSENHRNYGPKVVVRRRIGHGGKQLTLPISGMASGGTFTNISTGYVSLSNHWLTYPADAGDEDLAVHVRVRKSGHDRRVWVMRWFEGAAEYGPSYGFTIEDFFLTEAYLQAPGSGVQPAAQGGETSATWTGKVIAVDSAASSVLIRGAEIGGDASITVNFGNSPTVDVSLTNLRNTRSVTAQEVTPAGNLAATPYPSQTWTGLALADGAFSDTSASRSIKGAFRNQGTTAGTNANTAGGIFDVTGTMKGGFVANFAPPGPN